MTDPQKPGAYKRPRPDVDKVFTGDTNTTVNVQPKQTLTRGQTWFALIVLFGSIAAIVSPIIIAFWRWALGA